MCFAYIIKYLQVRNEYLMKNFLISKKFEKIIS